MQQQKNIPETPDKHPELFHTFEEQPGHWHTRPPAYLSQYKSAAEKLEYERRLPGEIQPLMREYFQRHSSEMVEIRERESVTEYFSHLTNAWGRHLEANELGDTFLNYEIRNIFGDWGSAEWRMAQRLLAATMETDHSKALYSGGIKAKLDTEIERLVQKYGHTDPNFKMLLLTPSFVTFYEARALAHKKYQLSVLEGKPDERLKESMLQRYYAGDEQLFKDRHVSMIKASQGIATLKKDVQDEELALKERSIKKKYFMEGRPDVQAFESLLEFDNTTEYEYTYALKGLPDLFLREEVYRRLVAMKEVSADRSVFSLSYDDFSNAIDNVLVRVDKHFTIRLRPYMQHFDTCGTACIMSILNRKGTSLDEETELRIWEMVGKPYNFPGGLAWVLLRNGFHVTYVQDGPELLRPDNPEFASMDKNLLAAAHTYVDLHKKAVDAGLRFEISDWGFERVRSEIERGSPCLLYLHVSDTMSHVVIARGIFNGRLEIIDPLGSIKYLSAEELNAIIVAPMGKRLLIVQKLPYDLLTLLDEKLLRLGY